MLFQFIETAAFTRAAERYLDDATYVQLQAQLNARPECGVLVPGSGGLRKLRWARDGSGKRGGLRVIYYALRADGQIWLLALYSKNVQENIPAHVLKALQEEIDRARRI